MLNYRSFSRLSFALVLATCVYVCPTQAEQWQSLFDGKSLEGWKKVGGGATYKVADGAIVGTTGEGKNTFLTKGPFCRLYP